MLGIEAAKTHNFFYRLPTPTSLTPFLETTSTINNNIENLNFDPLRPHCRILTLISRLLRISIRNTYMYAHIQGIQGIWPYITYSLPYSFIVHASLPPVHILLSNNFSHNDYAVHSCTAFPNATNRQNTKNLFSCFHDKVVPPPRLLLHSSARQLFSFAASRHTISFRFTFCFISQLPQSRIALWISEAHSLQISTLLRHARVFGTCLPLIFYMQESIRFQSG